MTLFDRSVSVFDALEQNDIHPINHRSRITLFAVGLGIGAALWAALAIADALV
jgi:uncharacterized protein (UPF0262 family)